MDEDVHEVFQRLAFEKHAQMAKLVRYAIDETVEDELDAMLGTVSFEESMDDPSSLMMLEEYMRSRAAKNDRKTRLAGQRAETGPSHT